jgi:hypothetical protein
MLLTYGDQIVAGSFEHALNEIVEERLDLSEFDQRYANDQSGADTSGQGRTLPVGHADSAASMRSVQMPPE